MIAKEELPALDAAHLIHPLTPLGSSSSVVFQRGQGSWLYDLDDKAYLDARAQLCCVNLGYGHRGIIDAVKAQLDVLPFVSLFYGMGHPKAIECAVRIAALTPEPLNRIYFSSGGSEANELAFSLVRKYWSKAKPSKYKIISRYEGYHGNTAGAMSATGMDMGGMPGVPNLVAGHIHMEPPYQYRRGRDMSADDFAQKCAEEFDQTIVREGADTVAAFVAEPIMGVGGFIAPPAEYWKRIREVCDLHNVLLIFDEVMTGFCRTGKTFACETYDVTPDLLVLGKGISSNYVPCGAVVLHDRIFEQIEGDYLTGFTNSGHPLAMAASLAALDAYDNENICAQVESSSEQIFTNLSAAAEQLDYIGEVSGKGLMIGVELVTEKSSGEPVSGETSQTIVKRALQRGLLIRARGSRIGISPPLNISRDDADILCERLLDSIASVCG